ncbi:MAG TPA: squalene synthase HpnC [Casimicrobiaceae bacterium]|nr:squalene synthase HpnC [Casimicrobiaceae bacterium]
MSVDHYENFPVASRLVPAAVRPAVVAIYRFARAADDLADEGDASVGARIAALEVFSRALEAIEQGETPQLPPFPALALAIREHALPIAPFHALISAFLQDCTKTRYHSHADVLDYCARSANPIGRLMLALFHANTPQNDDASDCICTGLQLTNFLQDVAIDWAKGRVYIPQDEIARFGVGKSQIAEGRIDSHWSALMAFQTARARNLLDEGRPLLRALPWRMRLEVAAMIAGGQRILARIDKARGDVFAHRPTLRARDWALVATRAMIPAISG